MACGPTGHQSEQAELPEDELTVKFGPVNKATLQSKVTVFHLLEIYFCWRKDVMSGAFHDFYDTTLSMQSLYSTCQG